MIILYILAAVLGAAVLYQRLGSHFDARRWPPPGRILDAGRCPLHLYESGAGEPVVILEAGIAASSISWALLQPRVAEFARVASYDRSGLGWSGPCVAPRNVHQMTAELAALLSAAQLPAPYILVGHSFGGLLIRAYAHLYPTQVAGLVFVDPVSLEHWSNCEGEARRRLQTGAKLSRRGALLARIGVVRAALAFLAAGGRRLPAVVARASAPRASDFISGMVGQIRKLPPAFWPMIGAHWSDPKSFCAMAAYLECLPASARAVLNMPIPSSIPFIILSASSATPAEIEERDAWTRQSPHGRHISIEDTSHWLQLERPDAVAAAIRELVELARSRSTGYHADT